MAGFCDVPLILTLTRLWMWLQPVLPCMTCSPALISLPLDIEQCVRMKKIVKFAITYQEMRLLRSKTGKDVKNRQTYPDGDQAENNQNKSQTVGQYAKLAGN